MPMHLDLEDNEDHDFDVPADLADAATPCRPLSKAEGYLNLIHSLEYDLNGAMVAFGRDYLNFILDEIEAGRVNVSASAQRWLTYRSDNPKAVFTLEMRRDYEQHNLDYHNNTLPETVHVKRNQPRKSKPNTENNKPARKLMSREEAKAALQARRLAA